MMALAVAQNAESALRRPRKARRGHRAPGLRPDAFERRLEDGPGSRKAIGVSRRSAVRE